MSDGKLSFPVEGIDVSHLEQTHNLLKFTPQPDPAAAFSLVLPKTWLMENDLGAQPVGIGQMTRIGLFLEKKTGPDTAIVQVYVTRLPFEVALRDWMEYLAQRFQTKLLSCEQYEFAVGSVVDAGGLYGPTPNQHVVRMTIHADGGRIFTVSSMVRQDHYGAVQGDLAIAATSFKLLHPAAPSQLEALLQYSGGEPHFKVGFPASWVSQEVPKPLPDKSGIDLVLSSKESMLGYVRVKAILVADSQPPSAESLRQTATQELQDSGISLAAKWQSDSDPSINSVEGLEEHSLATAKFMGKPAELRFGTVRRGALLFAVTLLSLPKAVDAILWMRSKRAYEIAMATAQPVA